MSRELHKDSFFLFFRDSAEKINTKVQRGLFLFAVSNSCMNPIVYGKFKRYLQTFDFKKVFTDLACDTQLLEILEIHTHKIDFETNGLKKFEVRGRCNRTNHTLA